MVIASLLVIIEHPKAYVQYTKCNDPTSGVVRRTVLDPENRISRKKNQDPKGLESNNNINHIHNKYNPSLINIYTWSHYKE